MGKSRRRIDIRVREIINHIDNKFKEVFESSSVIHCICIDCVYNMRYSENEDAGFYCKLKEVSISGEGICKNMIPRPDSEGFLTNNDKPMREIIKYREYAIDNKNRMIRGS